MTSLKIVATNLILIWCVLIWSFYSIFCVLSFPILLGLLWVWVSMHSCGSWFPICWANLTIFISVLESRYKSEDLVSWSTDWKITNSGMSQYTISINNVSGSESNSSIRSVFDEAPVISWNLLGNISKHWNCHWTESTLLSIFLSPFFVWKVGISGCSNYLAV